ncbi:monocarboxylate transporter 13-like [Portunus trituberculatus]|uniref:monocarboxylate transporter 13-like n=1 Tax=Portunus trituberculatus TaxID=210409 RepID=UPI001E1CE53B|nr:monocarboxylate transporter 13-like [Portunus trituberculatus]
MTINHTKTVVMHVCTSSAAVPPSLPNSPLAFIPPNGSVSQAARGHQGRPADMRAAVSYTLPPQMSARHRKAFIRLGKGLLRHSQLRHLPLYVPPDQPMPLVTTMWLYPYGPLELTVTNTVPSISSTFCSFLYTINLSLPPLQCLLPMCKPTKGIKSTASLYGYSFGTIFSEYLIEVRASPTKVSWIYNLFHVSACLGSVMGDTLVEEFGWRKVIFASGLLSSLGMVLSVFTTSADFLFFSYSILAGCVQRILGFSAIHVAVSYCPNHQSLVNAIVSSGAAISLLMSASFIFYLNKTYSFRGATLMFSGLCLNMCVAAMVFHPVEWHMDSPYFNFGKTSVNDQALSSGKTGKLCILRNILKGAGNTLHLITSPHAVLLSIIVSFNIGIFVNIWTFLPFVMWEEGYTLDEMSFSLSLAAGCNLGGRLASILLALCIKGKCVAMYISSSVLSVGTLIAEVPLVFYLQQFEGSEAILC